MEEYRVLTSENLQKRQKEGLFQKLNALVSQVIEEAIFALELLPGEKIGVSKVAGLLNVSATPVKEALDQLVESGLVEKRCSQASGNRNYYVFDIADEGMEHLFEARKAVESAAAFICARKNWTIDLDRLERNVTAFETSWRTHKPGEALTEVYRHDREFHMMLIEATGNEYLADMYATLGKNFDFMVLRSCEAIREEDQHDKMLRYANQHRAVFNAIKMGFPQQAKEMMEEHMDYCLLSSLTGHR